MRIGFTAGVFDLLHPGHLEMLRLAKSNCDHLIVAIQVDASRYREGKQPPVEMIHERCIRMNHCKYVDEVIVYETEEDLVDILKTVHYDVRFIGEDHKDKPFTGDNIRKETFVFNGRGHGKSSTELKERMNMNHSHDFEVLQNIFGPLTDQQVLDIHPDKEHQKEMEKELKDGSRKEK